MADRFVTVTDFGRDQQQAVDLSGIFDHSVGGSVVSLAAVELAVSSAGTGIVVAGLDDVAVATADAGLGAVLSVVESATRISDFGRDQAHAVDLSGVFDHTLGRAAAVLDGLVSTVVAGAGIDSVQVDAVVSAAAAGAATIGVRTAKLAFLVDTNHTLQPLDVWVLQDSRFELMPSTRENTEEIPGRHGAYDFGSTLHPRMIELSVANRQEFAYANREQIRATLATLLNPLLGPQALAFADDLDKTYFVKAVGSIDIVRRAKRLCFTIPFRCSNPFAVGTWEKHYNGSGTLVNAGTAETPLIIEIVGPVTNPSVVVAGQTLSYTGGLIAGDRVVIDTERMTVTFNSVNALHNFSGLFPKLQPGSTAVTAAAAGSTLWRWRDRWI